VSRPVDECLKSGLSVEAFCRQQNLDRRSRARRDSSGQWQNAAGLSPQPPGGGRVELAPEPDPSFDAPPSGAAR